jgi:hypothetical protein
MRDHSIVFMTTGMIVAYFLACVLRRRFDPFAPVWLFLVGYLQVYVIQAISYRDWALAVRGEELVTAANTRALWALAWFLGAYHLGIGRRLAVRFPVPPQTWSHLLVMAVAPVLVLWGLYCAGVVISNGLQGPNSLSPEESLLRSFPFVMMVAAILLIVTGRSLGSSQPLFFPAGLLVAGAYVCIWMFNGKRSHSLIGVLATVCACYITRLKRPSWPVLAATAVSGTLVVAVAIGWRNNGNYEYSVAGFTEYLGDFQMSRILESLNMEEQDASLESVSHETTEYGGFLLMMDMVPRDSPYDYGSNYIRVISTFIPRIFWPSKPLFGRAEWVAAWIAGSELPRDEDFTGPAIGILGATQLNGGAVATCIVLACSALLLRTAYEYFRLYPDVPWVQFWWSVTFFNAWFMVVGDDALTWFYYNWGFSALPIVMLMWWGNRAAGSRQRLGHQRSIGRTAVYGP